MSGGDHFPDRYFPERYFPERYFQGGTGDPNAMSASITATSSLVAVVSFIDHNQSVVEVPLQSTGGGGAARWYRGKYRGELRGVIRRALGDLRGASDRRKRKKIARKVAAVIRPSFDFWPAFPVAVKSELQPLELVRVQLMRISLEIKAAEDKVASEDKLFADRLSAILQEYETKARKIEQEQEEMVIATILLAA